MDKRIIKTKKNLKDTVVLLLAEKPFDQIAVTEICRVSSTSRVTFYSHFADKYDLLEEMFQDMVEWATGHFFRLQRRNNGEGNVAKGWLNVLDSIFALFREKQDFLRHAALEKNPYLYFCFSRHLNRMVLQYMEACGGAKNSAFTSAQLTGFICNGLWGFISESIAAKMSLPQIQEQTGRLLRQVLEGRILGTPWDGALAAEIGGERDVSAEH
ncbi:MAG: TetR/AcrR family transcriptional regulator [Firmicutes bacterium]|nr:TetR/AcrR family transcriptional regulator [Bacillota bacterium]